jgi:hypothetical protein
VVMAKEHPFSILRPSPSGRPVAKYYIVNKNRAAQTVAQTDDGAFPMTLLILNPITFVMEVFRGA